MPTVLRQTSGWAFQANGVQLSQLSVFNTKNGLSFECPKAVIALQTQGLPSREQGPVGAMSKF